MIVYALITAVVVLSAALAVILWVSYKREMRYQKILDDLLDRVMARNYGEYAAISKISPPERARKRRYMGDAELAELERAARHEIGALAAEQVAA